MPGDYSVQHRGDRGAYERYLAGMDASMRQKVALTAAHFLCVGKIADLGMGSGSGSHAFAQLYPGLDVVGVDVNPEMVSLASERYRLPNLSFVAGDVAARVFEPSSMDGLLDSSVLHHVTSFNGYDRDAAARALAVQAGQLRSYGVLVVRDFVDPGPGQVRLELPATDGDDSEDPTRCSTAALFRRFAKEFRKLSEQPGFAFTDLGATTDGFHSFDVSHTLAAEFLLRKDYRADWDTEVLEEYTFMTAAEFQRCFEGLGLRVLACVPVRNPWIVKNRFEGKARLSRNGRAVDFPATNLLIAGERVPSGEGVGFRETARREGGSFLRLEHFLHQRRGKVYDLVFRPNRTLDVVPYFEVDRDIMVLARRSYPRPILQRRGDPSLDGSSPVGYVTEPLSVVQEERPLGQSVEQLLASAAGVGPDRIRQLFPGSVYFPSPGGIQEEVRTAFVEVDPLFVERAMDPTSGCSTSGHIRALSAEQVLRAAQVGGLPDARLELGVYELFARLGRSLGPWLGEALQPTEGAAPRRAAPAQELFRRPPRRAFVPSQASADPFLQVFTVDFEELGHEGRVLSKPQRELVVPRTRSEGTVMAAVLRRYGEGLYLGLDDDDLPAVQAFEGRSDVWTTPAWRLPEDVNDLLRAESFLRERLLQEHGISCGQVWSLGGRYHPSAGLTAEAVYPFAVEVLGEDASDKPLTFVPLDELIQHAEQVVDGHLRIALWRCAHGSGLKP
ncbi:MAG: class I SAM-dependent methyltransferase [Polyangiaceae bacterium]